MVQCTLPPSFWENCFLLVVSHPGSPKLLSSSFNHWLLSEAANLRLPTCDERACDINWPVSSHLSRHDNLAEGRVCDSDWTNLGDGDLEDGEVAAPILCQEINAIKEAPIDLSSKKKRRNKSPSLWYVYLILTLCSFKVFFFLIGFLSLATERHLKEIFWDGWRPNNSDRWHPYLCI